MECKYHQLYTPLYEKRAQITKGSYEPTDVECEWPSDDEDSADEDLAGEVKDKVMPDFRLYKVLPGCIMHSP